MLEITGEGFVVEMFAMKRSVVDAFSARTEAPKALYVSKNYQLSLIYIRAITNQHHVSSFRQERAPM